MIDSFWKPIGRVVIRLHMLWSGFRGFVLLIAGIGLLLQGMVGNEQAWSTSFLYIGLGALLVLPATLTLLRRRRPEVKPADVKDLGSSHVKDSSSLLWAEAKRREEGWYLWSGSRWITWEADVVKRKGSTRKEAVDLCLKALSTAQAEALRLAVKERLATKKEDSRSCRVAIFGAHLFTATVVPPQQPSGPEGTVDLMRALRESISEPNAAHASGSPVTTGV